MIKSMEPRPNLTITTLLVFLLLLSFPSASPDWYDETHLAIAKAAGYGKWYNATGADIAKVKAGHIEKDNHYADNSPGTVVTPQVVLDQVARYNQIEETGHLYGAIVASLREYILEKKAGKYAEYQMAYCVHYVGDLSMPLHNTLHDSFNKKNHGTIDGTVNDEVLENLDKIKLYPIRINSEEDLAKEIACIANLSMKLGYQLESEDRLLTKDEAYTQLGHSASLIKAILEYAKAKAGG
jgi:hypothetical protein